MRKNIFTFLFLINFTTYSQIPPPSGCNTYGSLDVNEDGFTEFDIRFLETYIRNNALDQNFNLIAYQFKIYPNYNDRFYNTNEITVGTYTNIVNPQYTSYQFIYSGTGQMYSQTELNYRFSCYILDAIKYTGDNDNDGILNYLEDTNSNLNLLDDDIDNDGNPNYTDANTLFVVNRDKIIKFNFFPNPASRSIQLEYEDSIVAEATVKIYDIQGKLAFKQIGKPKLINIENLDSGLYFLNLEIDEELTTRKIIIN